MAIQPVQQPRAVPLSAPPTPDSNSKKVPIHGKVTRLMGEIIDIKEARTQEAASLKGRLNVKEAILIGGDLFSMGYLAFQGLLLIRPALAAIPAISLASLICGEVGGAINIAVAFICLQEGLQALKNGDKALATRLIIDFFAFTLIGLIMMLVGLATKIAVLGGISAFFAANPWLLPVLFFIVSIPVIVEVGRRIKNVWMKQDLGAQLHKDTLSKVIFKTELLDPHKKESHSQLGRLLDKLNQAIFESKTPDPEKNVNPYQLGHLLDKDEKEIAASLSRKFEKFQADMGVKAAIEAFKLMQLILETNNQEKVNNQLDKAKREVADWNRSQYVRMLQQILYTGAFGVSMVGLNPSMGSSILSAIQNFAMSLANAIPLYMDTFWPFKRNTPRVVANVENKDIPGLEMA